MANLEKIAAFLKDAERIRRIDIESSGKLTPEAHELFKKVIKNELTSLIEENKDLESPEKEYLESLKNFYELEDKRNKFDYSEIEKGKTPLDTPIMEFDFTVRTIHALRKAGIGYLGELVQYHLNDLLKERNFGDKSMREVQKIILDARYNSDMKINYVRPENRK